MSHKVIRPDEPPFEAAGPEHPLRAAIFDVDGVLWLAGSAADGSDRLLNQLRRQGLTFCCLANDCSVTKAQRHSTLTQAGVPIAPEQLLTAPEVTGEWLVQASVQTIMYLGVPDVASDLGDHIGIRDEGPVDAVVVGDLFEHYERRTIDRAAKAISGGARFVAMHRGRRSSDGREWFIDNGFWVAALEYVTEQDAVVTGKPSANAYLRALDRLGLTSCPRSEVVVISDDADNDLRGAKAAGLRTTYFGSSRPLGGWVDAAVPDMPALEAFLRGGRR